MGIEQASTSTQTQSTRKFALRHLLPVLLFLPLIWVLFAGLSIDSETLPSTLIGNKAPYFELEKLDNQNSVVTPDDLLGEVWLFNVWASWCVPCLVEHPVLSAIDSVPIVGLNYKDKTDAAITWLQENGNPFLYTVVDVDGRAGIDWGVYGVPETFLIDTEGVVRYKHVGPITTEDVVNEIVPLINKLKANTS